MNIMNNIGNIFDENCGEPDNYSEIFQLQTVRKDQFGEYNYIKQKNGAECRYYRPDYDFRSWVKKNENNGDIVLFHLHNPTESYSWFIMKKGENKFVKHHDDDDKPAEVNTEKNYKAWYQNGNLHRLNGPAFKQADKHIFAIEGKKFFNETDFKQELLSYYKKGFEKYEKVYDVLSMMPQELTDLIVEYNDNRIPKKELREKIKKMELEIKEKDNIEEDRKHIKITEQSAYKPTPLFGNIIQPTINNTEQRRPVRRFRP